jgi:hypothetical protein
MKIDSDYLWDKTGEPDPEIQQLEEILGTLRYEPRPLEIPVGFSVGRERSFFRSSAPRLAIAATIAMLLIGLGVWLAWQRSQRIEPLVAHAPDAPTAPAVPAVKPSPVEKSAPTLDQKSTVAIVPGQNETTAPPPRRRLDRHPASQSLVATNSNRLRNEARKAKELQEAVAAKDQLLLALRVTSAKLSFAQKKTQSANPPEPVHNQHKIG